MGFFSFNKIYLVGVRKRERGWEGRRERDSTAYLLFAKQTLTPCTLKKRKWKGGGSQKKKKKKTKREKKKQTLLLLHR